jgi:serine/threonine-protein kinase RsbT
MKIAKRPVTNPWRNRDYRKKNPVKQVGKESERNLKIDHGSRQIKITHEVDIAVATSEAMSMAAAGGFKKTEQFMIATAVSELARNIYRYANKGEINIKFLEQKHKKGIEIVAHDSGPGIEDIGKAMTDHFSTSGSLGLGLPGVKRLMDDFEIESDIGKGTKITAVKWSLK